MKSLGRFSLAYLGLVAWSAPATAAKIACVGDSITYGYGLSDPNTQSYPAVLQGLLGASHTVKNFGVSSTTLLKNGDRPYWSDPAFGASGDFAPDVVIIMLGTNDAKPQNWSHASEFAGDYQAMVAHYRSLGALVYVAAPPPVYDPGAFDIQPSVLNDDIVPRERQLASDLSAPLIDVYQALSGKAADFPDKVHPNSDGAKLIAQTVNAALTTYGFGGNGAAGAAGTAGAGQGGRAGGAGGRGNTAGANAAGTVAAGSGPLGQGGAAGSALVAGTSGVGGAAGASSGSGGIAAGLGGAATIAGAGGGNSGSAGNPGAAGRAGAGGTLAASGAAGRLSESSGAAGRTSTAGDGGHGVESAAHSAPSDGGCGCRVHHPAGMHGSAALFALSLLSLVARRRRRARR